MPLSAFFGRATRLDSARQVVKYVSEMRTTFAADHFRAFHAVTIVRNILHAARQRIGKEPSRSDSNFTSEENSGFRMQRMYPSPFFFP